MKIKSISMAILCLTFSASSFATVYTYDTNAYTNSTTGGSPSLPVDGPALFVTLGEEFTVSTDPSQIWYGADTPGDPNAATLTSNANGTTSSAWKINLNGLPGAEIGSLVGDINGVYEFIGAGTKTFTAWGTGDLSFQYADINYSDNSGTIVSYVTTDVPEPASLALIALGLLAVTASRRKSKH